jgi:hypothetical protein
LKKYIKKNAQSIVKLLNIFGKQILQTASHKTIFWKKKFEKGLQHTILGRKYTIFWEIFLGQEIQYIM